MLSETKRQVINLENCCIWLVNLFQLCDDARTCRRQTRGRYFGPNLSRPIFRFMSLVEIYQNFIASRIFYFLLC